MPRNIKLISGLITGAFAVIGPNGAGKSSTIGIIGTLVTKTEGNVKIFGYDIDENVAVAKSLLGVVSQEINFSQFEKIIDIVTKKSVVFFEFIYTI